jgi:hypothetical protein
MHPDTKAQLRRAHKIRIWTGAIVVVVGLVYAFGNPLWGRENTALEIVIGLAMVVFGAINIGVSVGGLRKLR